MQDLEPIERDKVTTAYSPKHAKDILTAETASSCHRSCTSIK